MSCRQKQSGSKTGTRLYFRLDLLSRIANLLFSTTHCSMSRLIRTRISGYYKTFSPLTFVLYLVHPRYTPTVHLFLVSPTLLLSLVRRFSNRHLCVSLLSWVSLTRYSACFIAYQDDLNDNFPLCSSYSFSAWGISKCMAGRRIVWSTRSKCPNLLEFFWAHLSLFFQNHGAFGNPRDILK